MKSRKTMTDRAVRRRPWAGLLTVAVALTLGLAACSSGSNGSASPGRGPFTGSGGSSTPAAPAVNMEILTHPESGKYFGVETSGQPDSLGPVENFAGVTGRKPDLIGDYVGWNTPYDSVAARSAWSYGALYYMAWEPFNVTLSSIADGASNEYIRQFALQVKAAGVPIALSFGHEMNGNWYPWGSSDSTAANFVAAWRLIHAIFAAVGATRVIWIWNPNVISASPVPLRPYYPGNSYVDWIGLTGYFPMTGPTTFAGLFGPTMAEIRQFTGLPFIIVETAVQSGPDEVTCTRNLVRGVAHNRDVLGLVWFEYDKAGVDWALADRPDVRRTFARAITKLKIVDVRLA
jgi:mannan endo-1,4-beta-mannosidase